MGASEERTNIDTRVKPTLETNDRACPYKTKLIGSSVKGDFFYFFTLVCDYIVFAAASISLSSVVFFCVKLAYKNEQCI